jgi:hypothetical protein
MNQNSIHLFGLILYAICASPATASVNPNLPFYGSGGTITADPAYPIVGENTHLEVVVSNNGDADALSVQVKASLNDWGVTFSGWQEIGTVTIPSITAGGTAIAEFDYVFQNRAHTCLEALIIGADQNDDVNDDRGQINLEVINSGETFSYGVPIRNHGDAPLDLLVAGRCEGQDGAVRFDCKGIAQEVHLEPGEEVIVPVELDLRLLAPGQEAEFILDAFDVGAIHPFTPANHNHVHLRIRRGIAQQLKTDALAILTAVRDEVTPRAWRNRIDEAANHIQLALGTKSWQGPNRLRKAGGAQVFAQEVAAISQLLQLLELELALSVKVKLNEVVLKLTDADRMLAQTANHDAEGQTKATELIQKGDEERQAGNYSEAVKAYLGAWKEAVR